MKIFLVTCLAVFILASFVNARAIDDLTIMTEQFPPYNFMENGKLQGSAIDLMALILKKINSQQTIKDIRILPWGRAYKDLQEKKNTMLFVMTRTRKRKNLFKWVGPISSSRNVLIAKKSRNIKINSDNDIKKYSVGAVRNDAGAQLVVARAGIEKEDIQIVTNAVQSIWMLEKDRIDLFAYDENVVKWLLKKEGLNQDEYESVHVLEQGHHYFAFNKETPDKLLRQIQAVLDEIKKQGGYDEFLNKYLR
ncbi:MAG: transporter substrate-binding domain-containing protein [Desulfobacula sp.]|nr:transporter substrate-binding domain-containing protein [Desulfobacula sp.]